MIRSDKKLLSLLGLAAAGGNIASGNTAVMKAIEEKKARMILLSCDCADNTVKEYSNKAERFNIPFYILDTEDLGHAIGHCERKAVAVLDIKFAQAIQSYIFLLNNMGVN